MGKYNTRGANKRVQRNSASKENFSNVAGSDEENSTNKENKRGRKLSKPSMEYEKEAKRIKITTNSHDSYCWKCKKIESDIECFPEVQCSTCVRTFHTSCIKATKINKDRICYVCQQQSNDRKTACQQQSNDRIKTLNIDDEIFLPKLLLHIVDTVCPVDKVEYRQIYDWEDTKDQEKLINKINFRIIHDKCVYKGMQYESYVELVNDIEWIHHNCVIVYGEKSALAKSAKKILLAAQGMLKDALDCPECYHKKIINALFADSCKIPHPLVWAKVKGWPYWPAKCLKASKEKASVRFFGTHQIANVALSSVIAMSKKYPSMPIDTKTKNGMNFTYAEGELKAYITLFEENYGPFPYESENESNERPAFNFKKQEDIMKALAVNYSKRMIVPEVPFLPSADSVPDSSPPAVLVDLTETENGDDQAQQKENVNPIILQTHGTNIIFANQKEFQALQHSLHSQAISGSLLPSQISDHNSMNWLTQDISISNVMSGTDAPSNSDLTEVEPAFQNTNFSMPSCEADIFRSSPVLPQSSLSSSNSMEICRLSNYGRSSESRSFCVVPSNTFRDEDIEDDCAIIEEIPSHSMMKTKDRAEIEDVVQSILKYYPKTYEMLKKANNMVEDFFVSFWATTSSLGSPSKIIHAQANEIRSLKTQLSEEKREKNDLIAANAANFRHQINNAGTLVRRLRTQVLNTEEEKKRDKENFDQIVKNLTKEIERLNEEVKKHAIEREKMAEEIRKHMEKSDRLFEERLKEVKTNKYCDNVDCYEAAKHLCCYNGLRSYAYCSEKCKAIDDVHRRTVCKAASRTDTQQLPEEKEAGNTENVVAREVLQQQHSTISSFTYTISSIQSTNRTSNKEIASTSASPQPSPANIQTKKVVAAKKTFEVAKNINRSSNADIF